MPQKSHNRTPFLLLLLLSSICYSQQVSDAAQASPASHKTIRYSDALDATLVESCTGNVTVIVSLYGEGPGAEALWTEAHTVDCSSPRYSLLLGSKSADGVPSDLFTTNEARWLGVTVANQVEKRALLVSVPYAMKAHDAETLGGRPAADYLRAQDLQRWMKDPKNTQRVNGMAAAIGPEISGPVSAGSSTTDAIPKYSAPDTLADSIIREKLVGADLRIGIGTGVANPVSKLEVVGDVTMSGKMFAGGFEISTGVADGVYILNTHNDGNGIEVNVTGTGNAYGFYATSESFNGSGAVGLALQPASGTAAPGDYSFGMTGVNFNLQGSGLLGWSGATDGGGFTGLPTVSDTAGLYSGVASTAGIPAVLDHRGPTGGTVLSARANGAEVVSMTTAGNITAAGIISATGGFSGSFTGSGASLTGVNASNLTCTGCVSTSELNFDVATQAELNAHKSSGDHDGRY
ncbi:MAG TPA: hypothetical protein VM056_03430, partial [Terriglobales bacterium]|nr:hypothetical protein [Terriglobales bacterium]